MKISTIAAAAVLALTAFGAQATIVNIDAKSSTGTALTLDAGDYILQVVGKAGGGAYDAWTYNSAGTSFRDAFSITADGSTYSFDFDDGTGNMKFHNFSSASAALSAFASGPFNIYSGNSDGAKNFLTGGYAYLPIGLDTKTTVTFGLPDYIFSDNSGGVSLSVTAAVPEPETYALMLAGLGALGFMARRRKSV